MQCAVVQIGDNVVVNIIVADPTDPAPINCFLVGLESGQDCGIGWIYDPATNTFTDPNPPPPIMEE